jgi:hypothetical protein
MDYASVPDLEMGLHAYFRFYNHERLHQCQFAPGNVPFGCGKTAPSLCSQIVPPVCGQNVPPFPGREIPFLKEGFL